jgi:hypothetical protein
VPGATRGEPHGIVRERVDERREPAVTDLRSITHEREHVPAGAFGAEPDRAGEAEPLGRADNRHVAAEAGEQRLEPGRCVVHDDDLVLGRGRQSGERLEAAQRLVRTALEGDDDGGVHPPG